MKYIEVQCPHLITVDITRTLMKYIEVQCPHLITVDITRTLI